MMQAIESEDRDLVAGEQGVDASKNVVVANAGAARSAPLHRTDLALWHEMIGANLTGAFLTIKHATPHLSANGGGSIVAISSIAGPRTHRYMTSYCVSKAALEAIDAKHALRAVGQGLDDFRPEAVAAVAGGRDLGKHPIALAPRDAALDDDPGRLAGEPLVPFDRLGEGLAILVDAGDLEDSDRRQGGCVDEFSLAAGEFSLVGEPLEERFEGDLASTLDGEMTGNLALADNRWRGLNEGEDLGFRGEGRRSGPG